MSTNPFEGEKKSVSDVLFFIMVLPILFFMIAWNRFGCSDYLPQEKLPEPPLWDIQIAYFDPEISRKTPNPYNEDLLQLLQGRWENNFLASVRLDIDENVIVPEDATSRHIVEIFDPKEPTTTPKAPLVPMVLDFYRIDGTIQAKGPSPKFVMVKKFKGTETTIVVVDILNGHKNCLDWEQELRQKYKDDDDREVDTMYFNDKGVGVPGDTKDIKKLLELSRS